MIDYNNLPRVLIVGAVPFNRNSNSRSLDAYFHNWPHEKLAQIFSNNKKPVKGHCKYLFQITDQRLLKRRFLKNIKTGVSFIEDELEDEWKDNKLETGKRKIFDFLYKAGSKKSPLKYLLRKALWKKKYWYTKELYDWVREFNPQVIFLNYSDDFYIPEIALTLAKKFRIPIISSISDDYIFNDHFSLSIFYHIYRKKYKKLFKTIMQYPGDCIYISDKIRDLYNNFYNRHGQTIYLSSEMETITKTSHNMPFVFSYFGNIRYGRNESLVEIGRVLQKIDPSFFINVYTTERNDKYLKIFKNAPGIVLCGSIPYSQVVQKTKDSDFLIAVEGTKKKDITITRFSLSTKAADCLTSGIPTIAYGDSECGLIEYLKSTSAVCVIEKKEDLQDKIKKFIYDFSIQEKCLKKAHEIVLKNHQLSLNNKKFEKLVVDAYNSFNSSNNSEDITMLIQTSDSFSDIWDTHVTLLESNYPDRKMRTIMVSDIPRDVGFEHVEMIYAGEQKNYLERLKFALDQIETKYVLLTQDDYFLLKKVATKKMKDILQLMKSKNADYVRLFKSNKEKRAKQNKGVWSLSKMKESEINLYPCIWKVEVLKQLIFDIEHEKNAQKLYKEENLEEKLKMLMVESKNFPIKYAIKKDKFSRGIGFYLKQHYLYFGLRK